MKELSREEVLKECKEVGLEFKKNGEPKLPKQTRKPIQPIKPLKTIYKHNSLYGDSIYGEGKASVSLKEILKAAKENNVDINNINFEIEGEYSDPYDCSPTIEATFGFYYDETIKNDNYDQELEKYNNKLKIYKIKLEDYKKKELVYSKQATAYNKWLVIVKQREIEKQIKKLQKEQESLLDRAAQ